MFAKPHEKKKVNYFSSVTCDGKVETIELKLPLSLNRKYGVPIDMLFKTN